MDVIDQRLADWATAVAAELGELGADVVPTTEAAAATKGISIHLFLKEILPAPPRHSKHQAPLQVTLKYLIFVSAATQAEANRVLEKLLFAAMEESSMELDLQPIADQFWLALGLSVRPCFSVLLTHSRASSGETAKPVAQPMAIRLTPTMQLSGKVLTLLDGERVPLAGAQVNIKNSNITAITNASGTFNLGAVPPQPQTKTLIVHYKQYSQSVAVSVLNSPIEILFQIEEL